MFTGLIQTVGRVKRISRQGMQSRLEITADFGEVPFRLGESIAVNGVCLSVEKFSPNEFLVYASEETVSRTTLHALAVGAKVNLEKALLFGSPLGGHLVSGHIDCVVSVAGVFSAGQSIRYRFSLPAEFASQVVSKGSVALDGISLTVNDCGVDFFEVNIIPQTQQETTVKDWKPGCLVNLETDIIGKYVARFLSPWQGQAEKPSGIDMEFLRKNGF